jgi:hypothetical protein
MQLANTTVIAAVGPGDLAALDAIHASNVRVVRPDASAAPLERAVMACSEARRTGASYCLHDADPLASVAQAWAGRFDREAVAGELELAVAATVTRWRARSLELPDYYLVIDAEAVPPTMRHWYLGLLHSAAPARVVTASPAKPVIGYLATLPSGRWWPPLDELLRGIDRVVPDQVAAPDIGAQSSGLLAPGVSPPQQLR